jgi:regulator of replication initiation timing
MARPTLREQCAALQAEVARLTKANSDLQFENQYLSHTLSELYHQPRPQIVSQWDIPVELQPEAQMTCSEWLGDTWYVHVTPPTPYQPYRMPGVG